MPASVIVNNLTVVHKSSSGISIAFPDVCKTPTPGGPVPIPYPNVAQSTDTANGSSTVKMDGNPIMLKPSYFRMSTGDEAGSALGVVSNKIKGKAYPKMYSFDVKVEGKNVFRLSDLMLQNGSSPTNTPPTPEVQPPNVAMGPGDPDQYKITKIKWDDTEACCGDEVKLSVETENFEDGWEAVLTMQRQAETYLIVGTLSTPVSGNKANPTWVTYRGPYRKEVKLEAKALGFGGPAKSSNKLLLKTAPEEKEKIGPFQRTTPQYKKKKNVPGIGVKWVPTGRNYAWEVCYELRIEAGQLIVTRKVDFDYVGLWITGASSKQKRQWKREIEKVWDNQFKLHREDCKRGDNCNCSSWAGGCCVFPIRVFCEWGSGHGKKVELHKGANDPQDWGGPNWWYSHTWWEGRASVPVTVRAHEFGHLIGMYDEYPEGACDPGRVHTNDPTSIMNAGKKVYPRHLKEFKDWFDSKAGGKLGPTKLLPV